jgi:uncharacterized membrane protein YbaN (DUF454 family)
MKQKILIVLGSLSLAMGIIGIFLPVLPTTPFFLLSLFLYTKSSGNLTKWLLGNRITGKYLENYFNNKSISTRSRIFTVIYLWTGLLVSALLVKNIYICVILLFVGIAVSIHILTLKKAD